MDSVKYTTVGFPNETENLLKAYGTAQARKKNRGRLWVIYSLIPWLSTVFFAALSLSLFLQHQPPRLGSFEAGFITDMSNQASLPSLSLLTSKSSSPRQLSGSLMAVTEFKPKVPLELVRFTGSPHFHENGTAWKALANKSAPWPENMQLFGTPSQEIDDNWDKLIRKRYFSISEEEAERAWGEKRFEYIDQMHGGYTAA